MTQQNHKINFSQRQEATFQITFGNEWTISVHQNILRQYFVADQTGCVKTSFVQSLVTVKFSKDEFSNKLFGTALVKFEWVSKISLSKSQENELRQSFNYS